MSNEKKMKLTLYGGAGWVTGANFVLDNLKEGEENQKIMIDCGMFQGGDDAYEKNAEPFAYNPSDIDVLIVTHAHADHIGRIPKLVRDGFRGTIYSTEATADLVPLMFADSLKIMAYEEKKHGREMLYTEDDVDRTLALWKRVSFHSPFQVGGGFEATFFISGHILGSAMVRIHYENAHMLFTGDLGNTPDTLLRDTEVVPDIRYLLMESVYGDRNHEEKDLREEKLKQTILETIANRGTLLIPSFALERTQNILYIINKLVESGEVPKIPVFLDSPLSIDITNVFKKYVNTMNSDVKEMIKHDHDVFSFPGFVETYSIDESKSIMHKHGPKIIISSAGMSHAGRIIFHEKHYLSDPNTILLFVGYQAVGTLGRIIQDGAKKVKILGEEIPVRAKIVTISGFSAHKDSQHLLEFVEKIDEASEDLRKVFVVMGEPSASLFLTQRIRDYLAVQAIAPDQGESFILDMS